MKCNMPVEKNIPNERLRNLREAHGWSQADLAMRLWVENDYDDHITSRVVGRWERNGALPSLKHQQDLCALFHVDAEALGFVRVIENLETPSGSVGKGTPNERLKYQRELRGWSKAEVARRIDTSALAISRWEKGEVFPTPFYRKRLCVLFEVDAEVLGLVRISEGTESSQMEEVGKVINELRRQRELRGWSQAEVADEIGTYPVNISRWERGETLPAFEFQERLCRLFKKSAEELGFVGV